MADIPIISINLGRCLLIQKYSCVVYDYERTELSKGYWNQKRKLGGNQCNVMATWVPNRKTFKPVCTLTLWK